MKNIFLIAKRDFFSQVKNKAFIVMTFLSPLLIAGAGVVIFFLNSANNSDLKNIAVIDESSTFITSFTSTKQIKYSFYTPQELQEIKDTLKGSKYLNAILHIPKNTEGNYKNIEENTTLITNGNLGIANREKIAKIIQDKIEQEKQLKSGIDKVALETSKANVKLNVFNVSDGKQDKGMELKIILALFLTYIIFMFVMIYAVKVMRSVIEEKSNRVVEIIISSVKPFELMMGKIIGTTFVAVTQFAIWIAMTMLLLTAFPIVAASRMEMSTQMMDQAQLLETNPNALQKVSEISEILLTFNYPLIIFIFIAYFILGYLFYSSIFAAIGSAVDSDTDTQQFTYFPLIPMMIGLYGSMTTFENPDGPVAFWLSMIPLTSPISMITRVPFDVPVWQLVLSLSLLLVSTFFMIYIASKIYRIGILIYGKKPTFKEMIKWINYKN